VSEQEGTQVEETASDGQNGGSSARTAVKAAAAAAATAAATGAAAMAVRKALGSSSEKSRTDEADGSSSRSEKSPASMLTSVATGGWEAARDAVLPLAEDAAGAAGSYLARNGPEVVRDKIVPRFISSFNEARKEE
jgi:hypothetical protein